MAALLDKIYREQDFKTDPNKDAERAAYYRAMLAAVPSPSPDPAKEFRVRHALAECLLRAGDSAAAVEELDTLRKLSAERGVPLGPDLAAQVQHTLAVAYLRVGEQENCLHNHGQDSCLLPIRGSGIHTLQRGAKGAVREFTAALDSDPKDLMSQWLLNIAYMQLGLYPTGVPARWLVPPASFDSDYDIKRFPDVAANAGLTNMGHSGGVVMEDFDGDGLLDLMVSSSGPRDQLRFYHNNGDGTFSDRTFEAGLRGEVGGLNIIAADYNNDGHPDLVVLRGGWWAENGKYPLSLLRNNGNGTFDDVTEEAGLLSFHPTQTAAFADFDNDGWLDLYVGHEATGVEDHPSQLFHNNKDGTFTDVAPQLGLAEMRFVKGVAWGDFNNDGRPDLYISRKSAANKLFRNDGPVDPKNPHADKWKFTEVTEQAGVAASKQSFATWFFDYDNDGWPDIFAAGYWTDTNNDIAAFEMGKPFKGELPRLFRNNHNGTFSDVTKQVKLDRAILVMGAGFGDLDNDGWLDIYLGTGDPDYEALLPNRMFRNNAGRDFQDVTTSGDFGHLQKGHGVAFGDINNDGQEDVFEVIGGAFPGDAYQSVLFANPGHGNHWITLELEGTTTNRSAFGVRIDVKVETARGPRHIFRTVGYGSSFGGNPLRQHIGLGQATAADVEIYWPTSQVTQRFRNLSLDAAFHIREGDNSLKHLEYKQFAFQTAPQIGHHH